MSNNLDPDHLFVLNWVQIVCKYFQQTKLSGYLQESNLRLLCLVMLVSENLVMCKLFWSAFMYVCVQQSFTLVITFLLL